jgi:hypothetical protein
MRNILVCCLTLLLTGCSLSSSNNNNASNGGTNSNSGSDKSAASKSKGDFSSPKAAVYTFIAAGTNRDAELLQSVLRRRKPRRVS